MLEISTVDAGMELREKAAGNQEHGNNYSITNMSYENKRRLNHAFSGRDSDGNLLRI